jgi:hypothetical protein
MGIPSNILVSSYPPPLPLLTHFVEFVVLYIHNCFAKFPLESHKKIRSCCLSIFMGRLMGAWNLVNVRGDYKMNFKIDQLEFMTDVCGFHSSAMMREGKHTFYV